MKWYLNRDITWNTLSSFDECMFNNWVIFEFEIFKRDSQSANLWFYTRWRKIQSVLKTLAKKARNVVIWKGLEYCPEFRDTRFSTHPYLCFGKNRKSKYNKYDQFLNAFVEFVTLIIANAVGPVSFLQSLLIKLTNSYISTVPLLSVST